MEFLYLLLSLGILAAIIFVCWLIDRKKKRQEKAVWHQNAMDSLKDNKNEIKNNANKYRREHQDWNKVPDLLTIYDIFAFALIEDPDEGRSFWKYVHFHNVSISRDTIVVNYRFRKPMGYLHGPKEELRSLNFSVSEFNKNWFVSEELASEEMVRRIENGEKGLNPFCIDL